MKKMICILGTAVFLILILVPSVAAVSLPEAEFTSNITEGTAPLNVLFIDESTNSPTSWLWSFGDGGTSASKNPSHTYKSAGSYTVTLTATNSAGSDTVTESGYITVDEISSVPVAAFIANVVSGSTPLAVQFVDSSSNSPTSWVWSFGDGATSTSQNPTHTYTSAGTYTVTLTATNSAGSNTVSLSGYITVSEEATAPVASFTASATSGSSPLAVQFVDSSSNSPTSWVWSFGDGTTSTSQNPTHSYTSVGTYTVTLTAINAAGSDTATEASYISVELSAPLSSFVTDITSGPAPLTVNFTDTSSNAPTEWYWVFGDGSTSSVQNVTHTYTSVGSYTVRLTASNSEGSNRTTLENYIIVTDAVIVPTAAFTSDITSGEPPLTIQFTDASENSPTSWEWSFGDGSTSTLQNPSHIYTSSGTFTVKLTATNSGGSNTATRSGYITVGGMSGSQVQGSSETMAASAPVTATQTTGSTDTSSSNGLGVLPYAIVAVLAVIGVLAWVLMKRPPKGPHHAGGKDL